MQNLLIYFTQRRKDGMSGKQIFTASWHSNIKLENKPYAEKNNKHTGPNSRWLLMFSN